MASLKDIMAADDVEPIFAPAPAQVTTASKSRLPSSLTTVVRDDDDDDDDARRLTTALAIKTKSRPIPTATATTTTTTVTISTHCANSPSAGHRAPAIQHLRISSDHDPAPKTSPPSLRAGPAAQSDTSNPSRGADKPREESVRRRKSAPAAKEEPSDAAIAHHDGTRKDTMNYHPGYGLPALHHVPIMATPPTRPGPASSAASVPAIPIKYTPVTGRISKAKKGIPVHTCDMCRPPKTFTRAEHLRRHQLSHQKPAFPCNFEGCERAFHRLDLLQRHQIRHDTPGDKSYKSPDSYSRGSSVASEPHRSSENARFEHAVQSSPSSAEATRAENESHGQVPAGPSYAAPSQIVMSQHASGNFSPKPTLKRTASQAQLPGSHPTAPAFGADVPRSTMRPLDVPVGVPARPATDQDHLFTRPTPPVLDRAYGAGSAVSTSPYSPTSHPVRTLRVPDEHHYMPAMAYPQDGSPWCSSASESTYSNSDASRGGHYPGPRGRSGSAATVPDWSTPTSGVHWSPAIAGATTSDLRASYGSPGHPGDAVYRTPPSVRQSSDPTTYHGYILEPARASTTAYKALVHPLSTLPSSSDGPRLAGVERSSREILEREHSTGGPQTASLALRDLRSLPTYIASFWKNFDPHFPIIHRGTKFEENNLLKFAIAAVGTQYFDSVEARQVGAELNEYCRRNIDLIAMWNLQTMQAILLTELFARFRGRKTSIQLSKQIEMLYNRLLNNSAEAILISQNVHRTEMADQQSQWSNWVESESRHRLLGLCYIFDVHQSFLLEQKRISTDIEATPALFLLPCPEALWNAGNVTDWQAQRTSYFIQPLSLVQQQILTTAQPFQGSPFATCLVTASFAARLPRDKEVTTANSSAYDVPSAVSDLTRLFPASPQAHTYLALYHTPLRDLLAIAGDTWVFAKKITPPSAFHAAQQRLRSWASSTVAAAATRHACIVLKTRLPAFATINPTEQGGQMCCLSDYWSTYICAIVCWAFGQRHQGPSHHHAAEPLHAGHPRSPHESNHQRASRYVDAMLAADPLDLVSSRVALRSDTTGIINAACESLERTGVGNTSSMLVDAICVLRRIGEEGKVKWF